MRTAIIFLLLLVVSILISFAFFNSKDPTYKNTSGINNTFTFRLTKLATFTNRKFLSLKKFDNKIYVLTNNSIMDLKGNVLFKSQCFSPYDFVVYNGNYFISTFDQNKIVSNKGNIEADVWPAKMRVYNNMIYVATLRGNKIDVIDPNSFKIVKRIKTPPTPVDFLFINHKLYILSSGTGAIFSNGKKADLNFGVFSMFSDGKYIYVISPKTIYKLNLALEIVKYIDTQYLINYAFFYNDKLYIDDTFGYIRELDSQLKEIDFKKFTDYAISVIKDKEDYYISDITGVYKNNNLILKSDYIVDLYDENHILFNDGRVKIFDKIVKINGYPLKIIVDKYVYCFNQNGYIYMFDENGNLVLKKFVQGGIRDVKLFGNKFYLTTLNTIVVIDKTTLNFLISKKISILPYKMKYFNGNIYILSIFSRVINEYSKDLSLIKTFPLQKTCYDFYFYNGKLRTDPNLMFSSYIQRYDLLISYDETNLYLKGKTTFAKISLELNNIIITRNIYLLSKTSLMRLDLVEK